MADNQLNKVRHDYIRYANCWEDADVLIAGLRVAPGDRVLSIGSAGDNSFSLLVNDPGLVVAVDINPVQLSLIELKKAAIAVLSHEQFLQFIGFKDCANRKELFEEVRTKLPHDQQAFWEARLAEIQSGLIAQGKFERYFQLFRTKILPFIHNRARINLLFEEKEASQQQQYLQKVWNSWRWKMLFKVFFSKTVMGRFGRDPAFLKEVKVPVSTFILQQAANHLGSQACQHNYFLQFILKGQFETQLPHYARKENYELIKSRIDRLTVFEGLAEDAFQEFSGFNKFNLSNIFEYMPPELFQSVAQNFTDNSAPGSRFVYWNLMVPRLLSNVCSNMDHDKSLSDLLTGKDLGFFYSGVKVDVRA